VIDFYSDEELDRLYAIITRGATWVRPAGASDAEPAALTVGPEGGEHGEPGPDGSVEPIPASGAGR
jgi:hypothetical protein